MKILPFNDLVDENLNIEITQIIFEDVGFLKFDNLMNIGKYCAITFKPDTGNSTPSMDKKSPMVYSRRCCINRVFPWLYWISSFISGSRNSNNSL